MTKYLHLHDLVFNQPHLCTQEYAETVLSVLSDKLEFDGSDFEVKAMGKESMAEERQANTTSNGTFVLPVSGSMTHKAGFLDAMSGIQSYQSIKAKIQSALDDTSVKNILLDFDSPGGTVAGAFDLRDYVMEAKEQKPIYAIAQDQMASAAYLIGSAATAVYATQTAQVGSIGVVAMHIDQSERNKKEGVKPTFIYQGAMKTAGNPHEKLSGEALEYIQSSVDDSYEMFVEAVAEARGLDSQVIRDTEARVYRGKKAEELGLVDEVVSFDSLITKLASDSQQRVPFTMSKGENMDKNDVEKLEADSNQISAEDFQKMKTENETLRKALIDNGFKITADGVKPEEKAAEEPKEVLEFEGQSIDLSTVPKEAANAFKKMVEDKKDSELEAKAAEMFPHLDKESAKEFASLNLSEKALATLKAADHSFAETMQEIGQSDANGEFADANDKLEKMAKAHQQEHGSTYAKAYAAVTKTDAGKDLIKEIYKKD